jgi:hypothetical protein
MASKGWGLFTVMIGLLGFVLFSGTLGSQGEAVVKVSPQGSAVIISGGTHIGVDAASGSVGGSNDTSSALKDEQPLSISPQPLPDLSGSPLFSLPPYDEAVHGQNEALKPVKRAGGARCDLYH